MSRGSAGGAGSAGRFLVTLWDINTSDRSRGNVRAVIGDARDVGVSAYANDGGEMFFTLPQNHPQIGECQPWLRHYEVKRWNDHVGDYEVVGIGLLNDFDATEDEAIIYGIDSLALFDNSISGSNTSYTSTDIGSIMQTELSSAIFQPTITSGKSVSRHIALGTIQTTGQTVTVLTSYQSRLQFCQQLIDIWQSDSSVRPILSVTRSSPITVSFQSNAGVDRSKFLFAYGGLVNQFRYAPGYDTFATRVYGVGQKREGATLLFSNQAYASESTYGLIQIPQVWIDVVNQTALDRKVKRAARHAGTVGKHVSLGLRINQVGPWEWGELGDSISISINRGITNISGLYTVWGQEWIGKADGSEDLFLSVLPKET